MARKDGQQDADLARQWRSSLVEMREVQGYLANGSVEDLALLKELVEDFPFGRDDLYRNPWISTAAASGSLQCVTWMLAQGVDPDPPDADGFPPLLACIDGTSPERLDILQALIAAGADLNRRGINGWTPLHLAAMRDDRTAMRTLLDAGADTTVRTNCDDNATAEEEARTLGHAASADFIAGYRRG